MAEDNNTNNSEPARVKVLERILEFIKKDNGRGILEITLASTDKQAKQEGWSSKEQQERLLIDTIQALPVDVARRVKLVHKG